MFYIPTKSLFQSTIHNWDQRIVALDSPMLTILFVPSGTLCLECVIGGALATEASFQIENMEVAPSEGTVVNGTLVVFDSETTFSEYSTIVRCMSGSTSRQAFVEHGSKSNSTHILFSGRRGDIDRCVCQDTKWSHNWSDTSEGVH